MKENEETARLSRIYCRPVTCRPYREGAGEGRRVVRADPVRGVRYVVDDTDKSRMQAALRHAGRALAAEAACAPGSEQAYYREKCALLERLRQQVRDSSGPVGEAIEACFAAVRKPYADYAALCLLTRDETEYLDEWIGHHLHLGIDRLFLYDNGVETDLATWVGRYPPSVRAKLTVVPWKGKYANMQKECYRHFLAAYGHRVRWVGFIDSDEFIVLDDGRKLDKTLSDLEAYGALKLDWVTFNASGQATQGQGPVRQRFDRTVDGWFTGWGKLIVDPLKTLTMYIHNAYLVPGCATVNADRQPVTGPVSAPAVETMRLEHYYTKSYEEWCKKMRRGTCDPRHRKRYGEFFELNPDLAALRDETMTDQGYQNRNS